MDFANSPKVSLYAKKDFALTYWQANQNSPPPKPTKFYKPNPRPNPTASPFAIPPPPSAP
jgi:hypothetical protein